MKITIAELRALVREGMYSDWMTTAGMCAGGAGVSSARRGSQPGVPGLGSPEDQEEAAEENDQHPQEKSQLALRYADRHPEG